MIVNFFDFKSNPIYKRGFAMLVFVVITSFSLLAIIISYMQNQEVAMNIIREFSNNEKSVRNLMVCARGVSGVLSKQPNVGSEFLIGFKGYEERGNGKNGESGGIGGNIRDGVNGENGGDLFCKILDINKCITQNCDYRAIIGNEVNRIYIEWKIDEYRIYISKLRFINHFVNSLDFL